MNVGKEVESVSQLSQFTIKNFQQHDRNGHQKGTWPPLQGGDRAQGVRTPGCLEFTDPDGERAAQKDSDTQRVPRGILLS